MTQQPRHALSNHLLDVMYPQVNDSGIGDPCRHQLSAILNYRSAQATSRTATSQRRYLPGSHSTHHPPPPLPTDIVLLPPTPQLSTCVMTLAVHVRRDASCMCCQQSALRPTSSRRGRYREAHKSSVEAHASRQASQRSGQRRQTTHQQRRRRTTNNERTTNDERTTTTHHSLTHHSQSHCHHSLTHFSGSQSVSHCAGRSILYPQPTHSLTHSLTAAVVHSCVSLSLSLSLSEALSPVATTLLRSTVLVRSCLVHAMHACIVPA